ncbi:hypothetical protein V473_23285 [Sphingobium cupriresistens LL01]|uniref:DUF2971 domain-containing protein n=2 Tax=Sphingobium cupriresistens TaxID=1132417 RepID=A0A0J7XIU2_9SPHN|nr:hypothetical protein V473_23285 [Sphingobium cupriresistens LL01]
MNDHSEIEHGRSILDRLLNIEAPVGRDLFGALDRVHDGISNTIRARYYQEAHNAREQTYMMSLCEHGPHDGLGQLSMWRAYGGPRASVALVFNPDVIFDPSVHLNVTASPVLYGDDAEVTAELSRVVDGLKAEPDAIAAVEPWMVAHVVAGALHFALLSIKHRGFAEEREWRVLARADELTPTGPVKRKIQSIGGIPQIVQVLPLHGHGSPLPCNEVMMHHAMDSEAITFLPQFSWGNLIDRIIVGPSLFPETVKAAIEAQLRMDGVDRWDQLVDVSEIPLRHATDR